MWTTLTGGAGADRFFMSMSDGNGDRITDYEYGEQLWLYGAPTSLEQYRLSYDGTDSRLDIDADGVGGFDVSVVLSGYVNGVLSLSGQVLGTDTYQVVSVAEADAIYGTQGADTLFASNYPALTGPLYMYGLRGDDLLNGGLLADQIDGGSGDDRLFGNAGTDTLLGGAGADLLAGQYDVDELTGGVGADRFFMSMSDGNGDRITDYEYGEQLWLYGAPTSLEQYRLSYDGTDSRLDIDADGVGGVDVSVVLSGYVNGVLSLSDQVLGPDTYQVVSVAEADAIYGTQGADTLFSSNYPALTGPLYMYGLRGDDLLNGGLLADQIDGGSGDDRLFGNARTDTLLGGAGADLLAGQYDVDELTGGVGADRFFMSMYRDRRR